MTDRDLESDILIIAKGDADALKSIYTAYWHIIYAFILSILHDHHTAEDVSQNVFVKIWANAGSYRVGSSPKAWIMRIARNEAIDSMRKNRREFNIDNETIEEIKDDHNIEETVLNSIAFVELLSGLPEDISEIISLNVIGEMSLRAVSRLIGMPPATVNWKYRRGITILKNRYIKNEGAKNE